MQGGIYPGPSILKEVSVFPPISPLLCGREHFLLTNIDYQPSRLQRCCIFMGPLQLCSQSLYLSSYQPIHIKQCFVQLGVYTICREQTLNGVERLGHSGSPSMRGGPNGGKERGLVVVHHPRVRRELSPASPFVVSDDS
jgi:hypothetical protein